MVVSGFIFLNKKRQEKDYLLSFLRIFWQVNNFAEKLKILKNSCSSINLKNCLGQCDKTFFASLFFLSCTSLDSDSWPYNGETRKKMNSWCLQGFFIGSTHLPRNWKLLKILAVPSISKNYHGICDKTFLFAILSLPVRVVTSGFELFTLWWLDKSSFTVISVIPICNKTYWECKIANFEKNWLHK